MKTTNAVRLKTSMASEYMGVSRQILSRLAINGKIPHYKMSTRLFLFDIADLDAYMDARRVDAVSLPKSEDEI